MPFFQILLKRKKIGYFSWNPLKSTAHFLFVGVAGGIKGVIVPVYTLPSAIDFFETAGMGNTLGNGEALNGLKTAYPRWFPPFQTLNVWSENVQSFARKLWPKDLRSTRHVTPGKTHRPLLYPPTKRHSFPLLSPRYQRVTSLWRAGGGEWHEEKAEQRSGRKKALRMFALTSYTTGIASEDRTDDLPENADEDELRGSEDGACDEAIKLPQGSSSPVVRRWM